MNKEFLSLLVSLGTLQAMILLVGINIFQPFNSLLKKIASALLLTMALSMVYYNVFLTNNELLYPYIDSLGTAAWMALFPLYHLFIKVITKPKFKLQLIHATFFIVPGMFAAEEIWTTLGVQWYFYFLVNDAQVFLDLWMAVFFLSGIYFIVKSIQDIKTAAPGTRVKELNFFSYAFFMVLTGFGFTYLVLRKNYTWTFEFILISLIEAFLFVLLFQVFRATSINKWIGIPGYLNTSSNHQGLDLLASKLNAKMDTDQSYLDVKLSLHGLAQELEVSDNKLSQLFKVHFKSSFYEFINGYRLEHVEKLLSDPKTSKYKITALAEMSGFNSKATFYKVFKEKHGISPTEFIKLKSRSN